MNNDTPQVFGEDTREYRHDAYPDDPGMPPDQDGEDFPPFRGWDGWGERVEPVGPDDEYPQPSFPAYEPTSYGPASYEPSSYEPPTYKPTSSYEAPSSYEQEYPHRPAPWQPGYPQGPGYTPDS